MNIRVLSKTDTKLQFVLERTDTGFANALRRTMAGEIPVMATEFVDIEENSSGFFDEVIAHRVGLIPLSFKLKDFKLKAECKCDGKGCTSCEAVLALEKTGPCAVTSGDFHPASEVTVLDKNIPIAELLEHQRLRLTAVAQLGYGREHAKWQAALVGYQNVPSVKVQQDKVDERIADICPTHVFEKKDGKVKVAREEACILCMRCVEASEGVKVDGDESAFIFTVETLSSLTPEQIVLLALDSLEKRTKEFVSEAKKAVK